ncbi:MAG: hypothetical protein ACLS3M_03760 [Collinsella sp.]
MKALVFLTALVGFVLINTVYILLVFIWKMFFNHRNVELGNGEELPDRRRRHPRSHHGCDDGALSPWTQGIHRVVAQT